MHIISTKHIEDMELNIRRNMEERPMSGHKIEIDEEVFTDFDALWSPILFIEKEFK